MSVRLHYDIAKDKKNAGFMVVKLDNFDSLVAVYDLYCTDPACRCNCVTLNFIEMADDKGKKDKLFSIDLDVNNWEVGNKHNYRNDIDCDELIEDFLKNLDEKTKALLISRFKKAKDYGKSDPLEWLDASAIENGSCFGYSEVFGDKSGNSFEYNGISFLVDDQYCMNPGCKCNEVILSFIDIIPGKEVQEPKFTISMKFDKYKYEVMEKKNISKKEIDAIVSFFIENKKDDIGLFKVRYKRMNDLGSRVVQKGKKGQQEQRIVSEKVGRNDPCPCGSGKKYKKCCG